MRTRSQVSRMESFSLVMLDANFFFFFPELKGQKINFSICIPFFPILEVVGGSRNADTLISWLIFHLPRSILIKSRAVITPH